MKKTSILDGVVRPGGTPTRNPQPHAPLQFQNRVLIDVHRHDGEIDQYVHEGNVLATFGLDQLVNILANNSVGSNWVIAGALGTHTVAEASTHSGLSASTAIVHLSQASMAVSDKGVRTVEYQMTFDDGSAYVANEVGIFNSNVADDSMVARTMLGTDSVNKGTGDTVNVSYQVIAGTAA
jgi:hypothetical protein